MTSRFVGLISVGMLTAACGYPTATQQLDAALRHDKGNLACYASRSDWLAFGADVATSPGPSWLVLVELGTSATSAGQSGRGYLVGRPDTTEAFPLTWSMAHDSLRLHGFNSFVSWSATLKLNSQVASGVARWSGDEVVTDSAGQETLSGSRWAVRAPRVSCDKVAAPHRGSA